MASLPKGSLPSASDDVLARSIQTLRRAQAVLQESGAAKDDPHLKEIEESLRQMETEAERRGLPIPKEPLAKAS